MATMKSKSISFNVDDPAEKALYEWSLKLDNFSGHVKSLLTQDKKKKLMPAEGQSRVLPANPATDRRNK